MLNRITGKSNDAGDDTSTHSSRRKNDDQASRRQHSESTASSNSTRQKVPRGEDRDRGFTPTSTSYASTTKNPYPNTASPSVALSYSVGGNKSGEQYIPPGLVRNASLADQMPKSKAGRDERDQERERNRKSERRRERSSSKDRKQGEKARSRSRDRAVRHREKKEKLDKKDRERVKDRGMSKSESGYGEKHGASRSLGDFNEQVGSAGFMQFPGQYDGGFVGGSQDAPLGISPHVQDQFPGQFPAQSTEPYRPPLAISEGGPGLAAEYYGDAGQSVSDQPGVRLQSPSLIIGAEPHLQAASAVAAPPPEPSATGGVGAAASFFNGSFTPEPVEGPNSHQIPAGANGPSSYLQDSNKYASTSNRLVDSHHSSSAPAIPTVSAAAAGVTAGYFMTGGQSSQSQRPIHESSSGVGYGASSSTSQAPAPQPPSTSESITTYSKPSKPSKHSSQPSNIPMYAAGAAGAAGLAAAAFQHNQNSHHSSAQNNQHSSPQNNHDSSVPSYSSAQHYAAPSMAHQHRHHGPLSKFVDFFKDPEGVAQFEEYTEYIGVCRYCFPPGSSSRDAPRKHHYRRRRSNEYLGSSTRVDKESRYGSSDGEGRRRNKKSSWLATGVAGYGLAKIGESLFTQKNDFDDTYSVRTGYRSSTHGTHGSHSPDRRSVTSRGVTRRSSDAHSRRRSRSREWVENRITRRSSDTHSHRRSRSKERVEKGTTRDGTVYKKEFHGSFLGGPTTTIYGSRHQGRARSRSGSRDRNSGITGAVLGTAVGSSIAAAGSRPKSRSPKKAFVRSKQRSREHSPELPSVLRVTHPESRHGSHEPHNSLPTSRQHKPHKKEKGGFFSFGNYSSSSSDAGGFFGSGREKQRGGKTSKFKGKDHHDADRAIMGLGAAAAALALNESSHRNKSKRISDLVAVKESKGKLGRASQRDLKHKKSTMSGSEDNMWESASEAESDSGNSALAYGVPARRRRSQESLSSESSGTGLWGWRWGSKKKTMHATKPKRQIDNNSFSAIASSGAIGLTGTAAGIPSIPYIQPHDAGKSTTGAVPLQLVYPVPTSDPSRFDVARANSAVSPSQPTVYSRPGPVPIQHPQPIAQVSPAVYSAQLPYGHSYSAPTGPPVVFPNPTQQQPLLEGDHRKISFDQAEDNMPGSFPSNDPMPDKATTREVMPRRRNTSPAAPSNEIRSKNTISRRRSSLKEDSSSIQVDLNKDRQDSAVREKRRELKRDEEVRLQRERGENRPREKEDEELRTQSERREKRRQAKEEELRIESERWEAAEQKQIERDRRAFRDQSSRDSPSANNRAWDPPATAAAVAAAVGTAVAVESSKKDTERDERREKKRKERESQRDETTSRRRQKSPEEPSEQMYISEHPNSSAQQKPATSVPQVGSNVGTSDFEYEDYASFFAPAELSHRSREPKEHVASANADNDITVYQTPEFIVREPAGLHGSSRSPAYSYPPDELGSDRVFPSWVPRLNLIEPTPPASRASSTRGAPSPVIHPLEDVPEEQEERTAKSNTSSKVTWGESETREYTVVTPLEQRDQFVDSPENETNSKENTPESQNQAGKSIRKETTPTNGAKADRELGDYGNDLEFAATLAAGLEDTGFNPSIVIDDPVFRRRDSPPGSEETITAEVASVTEEAPHRRRDSPKREVDDPPRSIMPGSFDDVEEFDFKLSKKDRKKREKAAKRQGTADTSKDRDAGEASQSRDIAPVDPEPSGRERANTSDEYNDRNGSEKSKSVESRQNEAGKPYAAIAPTNQNRSTDEISFGPFVTTSKTKNPKAYQREVNEDLPEDNEDEPKDRQISQEPLHDDDDYEKKPRDKNSKSSRDLYESPSEDAPSISAAAPVRTETSDDRKHRKKSKRNGSGYDDAASVVSSPAAINESRGSKNLSKEKERKGGIFGLFGKSTDKLSEASRTQTTPEEATFDDFEEPKKKSKRSKDRKSSRGDEISNQPPGNPDEFDDEDKGRSHRSRDKEEKRRNSGGSAAQDSGRITRDLPAKDPRSPRSVDLSSPKFPTEDERQDEQQSESFLGMRRAIPPSPDIPTATPKPPGHSPKMDTTNIANISTYAVDDLALLEENRRTILAEREKHGNLPSVPNSQPTSPLSNPSTRTRRLSEVKALENIKVPATATSPTAVPFRWREPPQSPSFSRVHPLTPLSSLPQQLDTAPIRSKVRPRSTEFKSSTEFRPLWLVERHGSRQEPASEEVYPSLPSSHTTSRASSIHDPEETEFYPDPTHSPASIIEPLGGRQGLIIDTEKPTVQSDLLDSQEPTPTASSFQAAERGEQSLHSDGVQHLTPTDDNYPGLEIEDSSSASKSKECQLHGVDDLLSNRRQASPSRYSREPSPRSISEIEKPRTPSAPVDKRGDDGTSSLQKAEEMAAIIGGSAAFAKASTTQHDQQPEHGLSATLADLPLEEDKDFTPGIDRIAADDDYFREAEFSNQKPKKAKKKKRKASQAISKQDDIEPIVPTLEPNPLSPSKVQGRLGVEEQRELEEKDAQDAVDSWFTPNTLKKSKKDKKGKKKNQSADLMELPQVLANDTMSPTDELNAAPRNEGLVESNEATNDLVDTREFKLLTPEIATHPTSDEPPTLSKGPESSPLTRGAPMSDVVESMTTAVLDTKTIENDLPIVYPTVDHPSRDEEWQNFGRKSDKKGQKTEKAAFAPWERKTEEPLADAVKRTDLDSTMTIAEPQDDFAFPEYGLASQASRLQGLELENPDKDSDLEVEKETYEPYSLSKKKSKKSRKKAGSLAEGNASFDAASNSPQEASRSLRELQNPFEATSGGHRIAEDIAAEDIAADTAGSTPTSMQHLDGPTREIKKGKKGKESLREIEDPEVEGVQALDTKIVEPGTRHQNYSDGQHLPDAIGSQPLLITSGMAREHRDRNDVPAVVFNNPLMSPEATLLPVDDDLDLLDALPESPLIIAADLGPDDLDTMNHGVGEGVHNESSSLADKFRDITPIVGLVDPETDDGKTLGSTEHGNVFTATDTSQDLGFIDDTSKEAVTQKTNTDGDDSFAFTAHSESDKGKESKQSIPETHLDLPPEIDTATSPTEIMQTSSGEVRVRAYANDSTAKIPTQLIVDDWATLDNEKEKIWKKQSLLAESSQPAKPQEQDKAKLPASSQPAGEGSQARDIPDENDCEVPQEPLVEEELAGFVVKMEKNGKKETSVSQEPIPASSEPEKSATSPFNLQQPKLNVDELASDTLLVDLPQHLARSHDQNVQAKVETKLMPSQDESLVSGEIHPQDLPGPTADDAEWGLSAKKGGKRGKRDKNPNVQDSEESQSAPDFKQESYIEAPTATTDTAREIQDLLAESQNTPSSSSPLGASIQANSGLLEDSLDKLKNNVLDDFQWEKSSRKKEKKGRKARMLMSEGLDTNIKPQIPSEAVQSETLPLAGEYPLNNSENANGSRDTLTRTQSEPIISKDQGIDPNILEPLTIESSVVMRPLETELTEQTRALSPETAALLSRDNEKPPDALKAADIVPGPEFEAQLPSESHQLREAEKQPSVAYLNPIIEDQVFGVQEPSSGCKAEPDVAKPADEIVNTSEATEATPLPLDGIEGASEFRPTLSKKDKKKAKKNKMAAWSEDLDPPTPGTEHVQATREVQEDVMVGAPEVIAQDKATAEEFESVSNAKKDKKKDKKSARKEKPSTWEDETPPPMPGAELTQEVTDTQKDPVEDSMGLFIDRQVEFVADEGTVAPKNKKDKKKSKKSKVSMPGEDDATSNVLEQSETPEATIVTEDLSTVKANSDKREGPLIYERALPAVADMEGAPKSNENQSPKISAWDAWSTKSEHPEAQDLHDSMVGSLKAPTLEAEPTTLSEPVIAAEVDPARDGFDNFPVSKRDKKKAKKSNAISLDDETVDGAPQQSEFPESVMAAEIRSQDLANDTGEIQKVKFDAGQAAAERAVQIAISSTATTPQDGSNTVIGSQVEQIAEPEPGADTKFSLKKSKKDKKKAKKAQVIDWDEDVAVTEAIKPAEEPIIDTASAAPISQHASVAVVDSQAEQTAEPEPHIDSTYSVKKSKKDKKKARKTQEINWDEGVAAAEASRFTEDPILYTESSPPLRAHANTSPFRSPHQEIVQDSGHTDFVQPIDQAAEAHHIEERGSEDKSAEFAGIATRELSKAIYNPSSVHIEESIKEPLGTDHLSNFEPIENLSKQSMDESSSTTFAYDIEDKSQDHQAPGGHAYDNLQEHLADREINQATHTKGEAEIDNSFIVNTADVKQSNDIDEDDNVWDVPVKKGKKGKKGKNQRKDKSFASETSIVSEAPHVSFFEGSPKVPGHSVGAENTENLGDPPNSAATGESSELAVISDYEIPGNERSFKYYTSPSSQPLVSKHEPVEPSGLVIEAETQGLKSSTVGGTSVPNDDFSTFTMSKKGKKGKKGKRQQTPIIWEDDTATEPVIEGAAVATDQASIVAKSPVSPHTLLASENSTQQSNSWAPEEEQHRQVQSTHEQYVDVVSPTDGFNGNVEESSQYRANAENYSNVPYDEDRREIEEEEEVKLSEPRQETSERDLSIELKEPLRSMNAFEGIGKAAQNMGRERTLGDVQSSEEQVEVEVEGGYTPAETGRKGKMSKSRGIEREMESTALGAHGVNKQSESTTGALKSTDQAAETVGQQRALGKLPPSEEEADADWGYPPTKKGKKVKKSETEYAETKMSATPSVAQRYDEQSEYQASSNESRAIGDIATTTATGLGLGIIASQGLKESRKEGRKSKRDEKASEWTDFEEGETSRSAKEEDNYNRAEAQAQAGPPEQRRPAIAPQHFQYTPPLSPQIASDTRQEGPSSGGHPMQSDHSINRDSGIQVSDSPIVTGEPSEHRVIRDSGYQDMETSPLMDADPEYRMKTEEREIRSAGLGMEQHGRSHQSHGEGTPAKNLFDVSVEVSPDYAVSVSRSTREHGRVTNPALEDDNSNVYDIKDCHPSHRRSKDLSFDDLREPSPVSSTTKDRSSVLFQSSPSTREELAGRPRKLSSPPPDHIAVEHLIHEARRDLGDVAHTRDVPAERSPVTTGGALHMTSPTGRANQGPSSSLFGGPVGLTSDVTSPPRSPFSPDGFSRRRLDTITEFSPEASPLHTKGRHLSDVGSPEHGTKSLRRSARPPSLSQQRVRSPPIKDNTPKGLVSTDDLIARLSWPPVDEDKHAVDLERSRSQNTDHGHHSNATAVSREGDRRSMSGASIRSGDSISAIIRTPDQVRSVSGQSYRSSGTPPLRRVDARASGDLRLANKKSEARLAKDLEAEELEHDIALPSSSTYDPVKDKGKTTVRDMADVYQGWGDVHGQSPRSPTRPPSMRRRQSLQVLDLETKLDQLVSENRLLQSAKSTAERSLEEATNGRNSEIENFQVAIQTRDSFLSQKDAELNQLKHVLQGLQSQVAQLTEVNQGLSTASRGIDEHEQRYSQLQTEHAHSHQQWEQSLIELDELRQQHSQLSAGMEDIVRHEVNVALEEKNLELRKVQNELEATKEQVRVLQRQILASRNSDDLIVARDEDFFDDQCQELCQHVQQWVLRFSKFSDRDQCFLASAVKDESVVDRFENAILDGSDVDSYLADRVKRRDVFMSVVMTMIFDYIFTRYLFGMDREQRQKLKSLQNTLSEVGPMTAVHKWRATTLTLLSRRQAFAAQRAQDTEAVMEEIYKTLAAFLPPPAELVNQIQGSLRKVLSAAVDLHIEMRTQRAEYVMLPPLQPEYDTNGDLARKVYFNAALMNERSGDTASNDALEAQHAVVRMVLFPLVVKRGDDAGIGDEEIVVCPAQVLTAKPGKEKKTVRVMSVAGSTAGGRSVASLGGSDVGMGNMI